MRNPELDLDSRRPTMDFDISFVFPSLTDDSRANTNKKEIEGCRHLAVGENPPPFSSTEKYVPKPSDPSSTDQVRQYSGPQTFRPRKNESCTESRISSERSYSVSPSPGQRWGQGLLCSGPSPPKSGHIILYRAFSTVPLCPTTSLHEKQCADIASCVQARGNPWGQMADFHNKDFIVPYSCLLVSRKLPAKIVTPSRRQSSFAWPWRDATRIDPTVASQELLYGLQRQPIDILLQVRSLDGLNDATPGPVASSSTPLSKGRDRRTGAQIAQEH